MTKFLHIGLQTVRKDFGSQSPPSFSHTLTPVDCKAGELIRLDVIVIGSRPVDVHWLKDGVKVEPSIVYKMLQDGNQHTLLILEAQPRDSGTYECIAINVNGKATCCTAVKVGQGEPAQQQIKSQASVRLASDQSESGVTSGIAKDKAPQVIEELTPVLVNEGSAASFRCRIANIKSKLENEDTGIRFDFASKDGSLD